ARCGYNVRGGLDAALVDERAATQGWDQTGSNGVNLSFPEESSIAGTGTDEWIVGAVNIVLSF
ncbi:hypothetical protein B0H14DRAFT_3160684, partial [Mycena olivaceomarginata]